MLSSIVWPLLARAWKGKSYRNGDCVVNVGTQPDSALEHLGETKQRETGEGEVYKISWRVGCSPVLVTLLLRNLLTEPALDAALGILSRIVFGWILGKSISNWFLLRDAIKASRTFC